MKCGNYNGPFIEAPFKYYSIWPSGYTEDFNVSADQKQESSIAAMFVDRSGHYEQNL